MARLVCRVTGVEVEAFGEAAERLASSGFDLVSGEIPKKKASSAEPAAAPEAAAEPAEAAPADGADKPEDMDNMEVKELRAWCVEHGIEVKPGWKRADFKRAIEAL